LQTKTDTESGIWDGVAMDGKLTTKKISREHLFFGDIGKVAQGLFDPVGDLRQSIPDIGLN
jgi:hypothetical protein